MTNFTISFLLTLDRTIAASLFENARYPWEILSEISKFILNLGPTLPESEYTLRGESIYIHKSAKIAENASVTGPCIICAGAEIRHCAFIRGNAIVGENAVVGNSTELKNVILFDNVQVPHYNYVGDSVLGYKSHMGAGAITSNVKSDKSLVSVDASPKIFTGLKKFGAVLGDNVEVGCNSVLNPGTVIGKKHQYISPVNGAGLHTSRQHIQGSGEYCAKNAVTLFTDIKRNRSK